MELTRPEGIKELLDKICDAMFKEGISFEYNHETFDGYRLTVDQKGFYDVKISVKKHSA